MAGVPFLDVDAVDFLLCAKREPSPLSIPSSFSLNFSYSEGSSSVLALFFPNIDPATTPEVTASPTLAGIFVAVPAAGVESSEFEEEPALNCAWALI